MASPKSIDRWPLLEELGRGGNAVVWLSKDGAREIALKVLKTKRSESEQYARFRNEIAVLEKFDKDKGILPIIDASLPKRPTRNDPAWIAMPRATLIRQALKGTDPRKIVTAMADVSETLARVASEGIAHRDVKPDNLFRYNGRWVIGDFGIAHIPTSDEVRLTSDRLGPFGYTPDELMIDPASADPFRVDVFQLAKTLLVLVSDASYPPQGHIPAGSSGALSRYVATPRSDQLDDLIDRCTRREPSRRPTMDHVASELRAWLTTPPDTTEPDLGDLIAQFRQTHQNSLDEQSEREQWLERFNQIGEELSNTTIAWVAEKLEQAGVRPQVAGWHDHEDWVKRTRYLGSEGQLDVEQRWVTAAFGNAYRPTKLAVGVGLDVDQKGELWCAGHVAWGDMETSATRHLEIAERTAQIESIEVSAILADLHRNVQNAVEQMLRDLASRKQEFS